MFANDEAAWVDDLFNIRTVGVELVCPKSEESEDEKEDDKNPDKVILYEIDNEKDNKLASKEPELDLKDPEPLDDRKPAAKKPEETNLFVEHLSKAQSKNLIVMTPPKKSTGVSGKKSSSKRKKVKLVKDVSTFVDENQDRNRLHSLGYSIEPKQKSAIFCLSGSHLSKQGVDSQ